MSSLADEICALGDGRLRIAIDGLTAAGKSIFGNELAEQLRGRGRPTLRASLDDFKKPWRDALKKGYDRTSGEGYYRNAHDFASVRRLLLEPAGVSGDGRVVLCAFDPLTGADCRGIVVEAPSDSVLVVDGVFALRPEYNRYWEYRIWLHVVSEVSFRRGVDRDTELEGPEVAKRLHRYRYRTSADIYLNEVDAPSLADVVVDNTDFANPRIIKLPSQGLPPEDGEPPSFD